MLVVHPAKACKFCEAAVADAPFSEDEGARKEMEDYARDILENMPPDVFAELQQAMSEGDTAEEFADRIFVGDCPKCGSAKTGNCENDPDIQELLVGRCYECGQLWCTECERLMDAKDTECPCWDEEDDE